MNKKLFYLLLIIILSVLAFSGFMIFKEVSQGEKEKNDFKKLEEIISSDTDSSKIEIIPEVENETKPEEAFKRNLAPLFEQNPDCIGWICIEGTNVDYPVMHTPEEPEKYLRKNFAGEYAMSGVPFLDGTRSLSDQNLVIYGHNMKNKTMFSDSTNYVNANYIEKHPVIEFETAEGVKMYEIFAVACIKGNDLWYYFYNSPDKEYFSEVTENILSRSLYTKDIPLEYENQLLTLSTCYGKEDNDRLIIIGTQIT